MISARCLLLICKKVIASGKVLACHIIRARKLSETRIEREREGEEEVKGRHQREQMTVTFV